jgi:hypothetical protein
LPIADCQLSIWHFVSAKRRQSSIGNWQSAIRNVMSTVVSPMRHVRGFDVARPLSIGMLVFMMLPLVFLPLASIFIFGTSNGLDKFWGALMAPEAVFALKLSMATSFWATLFNVLFGLFAAYVLSRYNFWGRNALIVTISHSHCSCGLRATVTLGTIWHARSLFDTSWFPVDVHSRGNNSGQYLRDIPARVRCH